MSTIATCINKHYSGGGTYIASYSYTYLCINIQAHVLNFNIAIEPIASYTQHDTVNMLLYA